MILGYLDESGDSWQCNSGFSWLASAWPHASNDRRRWVLWESTPGPLAHRRLLPAPIDAGEVASGSLAPSGKGWRTFEKYQDFTNTVLSFPRFLADCIGVNDVDVYLSDISPHWGGRWSHGGVPSWRACRSRAPFFFQCHCKTRDTLRSGKIIPLGKKKHSCAP